MEAHLHGRPMEPMRPWYAGFTGQIEERGAAAPPASAASAASAAAGALDGAVELGGEDDEVLGDEALHAIGGGGGGGGGAIDGFVSRGAFEWSDGDLVVTELPLGRWTAAYKKWLLEQMAEGRAPWQSFSEAHSERHVRFRLRLSRYMRAALQAQDERALQAQVSPRDVEAAR